MRLGVYGGVSVLLALAVITTAFYQRSNFYAACIYLSKSNACMMILMNTGLFVTIVLGQLLQSIFFGELRAIEVEHLYEQSWYAVTETCLAMTIFRDEFDTRFVVTFTTLLFLKIFHWLVQDRVDFMEQSPAVSTSFHVRMASLMTILCAIDCALTHQSVTVTMRRGPSMMIMFGFEYAILASSVISTFGKYALNVIDMRSDDPWENKSIYVFYLELLTDFFKLTTYLIFFLIILHYYGLPLHIIRDVYVTFRSFVQKWNDLYHYRRATRNMNERYPDATDEELVRLSDRTCIICREEMHVVDAPAAPAENGQAPPERPPPQQQLAQNADTPKKLPCGHIFHFHCLRSWLERQQSCPTCRRPVLQEATPPVQPQPRPAAQQPNVPPVAQQPGFPPLPQVFVNHIGALPPVVVFPPPVPMMPQPANWVPAAGAGNADAGEANAQENAVRGGAGGQAGQQPQGGEGASTQGAPQTSTTGITAPTSTFHTYLPSGLIPLLPFANPATSQPFPATAISNGLASSIPSLDHLNDEQLRVLETRTREALVERLRILQAVQNQITVSQNQIYDTMSLLTQAISVLPTVPPPPTAESDLGSGSGSGSSSGLGEAGPQASSPSIVANQTREAFETETKRAWAEITEDARTEELSSRRAEKQPERGRAEGVNTGNFSVETVELEQEMWDGEDAA